MKASRVKRSASRFLLVFALLVALIGTGLGASPQPASAQPLTPAPDEAISGSLLLDGDIVAVAAPEPVVSGPTAVPEYVRNPGNLFSSDTSSSSSVERGAPPAPPAPTPEEQADIEDTRRDEAECAAAQGFDVWQCIEPRVESAAGAVGTYLDCVGSNLWMSPMFVPSYCSLTQAGETAIGAVAKEIIENVKEAAYMGFLNVVGWVLEHTLGPRGDLFNPTVDCATATDATGRTAGENGSGCGTWFAGQVGLMAQIGLWIIMPLMILVVIQSVIRGSVFMLVRSALVLLPAAILGTVVVVTVTQLLLNLADEFSGMVINVVNADERRAEVAEGLRAMGDQPDGILSISNLFMLLAMLVAVIAGLVIMVELLLREVGVYLAVLFLPLCFAAMVWPSTARYAKRLVEILIGLIFLKVLIAAGISLGMAAIADIGRVDEAGQTVSARSIFATAAVMVMVAVAPTRMLRAIPGGSQALEGRIAQNEGMGGFIRAGEGVGMVAGRLNNLAQGRARGGGPRNTTGVV